MNKLNRIIAFLSVLLLGIIIILVSCKKDDDDDTQDNGSNPEWKCGDPIVDERDGQKYSTVQIGDQCWMKENLKVGTRINGSEEMTDNGVIEKYCYDDDPANCDKYGGLYQWNELMGYVTTPGVQGICPDGWHVPADGEWTALTDYIGGWGEPHGNELKSCRQVNSPLGGGCNTSEHPRWNEHETHYGTNDYGFSGLPGGFRYDTGNYTGLGNIAIFWSSTDYHSDYAWGRTLVYLKSEC